jgi:hypothetical protein
MYLLDYRQWCACTGDGEVRRRPEVCAHAGADTLTGEFAPDRVSGMAFEALDQEGDRLSGGVSDEQVHVVGFAVELDQLDIELGADSAHGGFGEREHRIGEQRTPVVGHQHQVRVQQRHGVPRMAVGRCCQWSPLRLWGG